MKLPIRLRPGVATDLSTAANWYNNERPGLGDEFVQAAYDAFDVIAERPLSFPVVRGNAHRALLKRFPYAIYFRVEHETVVVLVVIHTARSASVWRKRLK